MPRLQCPTWQRRPACSEVRSTTLTGTGETIFLHAFDLYATRFLEAAKASLQSDDAGHMLSRFFGTAIANMTNGSPPRGCLTTKTASDGSVASDGVRQKLRDLLDALSSLVETALKRPGIGQQLALEPADAAGVVVTFTRGLAVMERVYGDRNVLLRNAEALTRALAVKPAADVLRSRSRSVATLDRDWGRRVASSMSTVTVRLWPHIDHFETGPAQGSMNCGRLRRSASQSAPRKAV